MPVARSRRKPAPRKSRPAVEARSLWDAAIDSWEDFEEGGKDFSRDRVHGPALLRAIGRVRGLRVLDLGCGQGRFTRSLARRGARVTGIDWSTKMIETARRHEQADPLGIQYYVADARNVGTSWSPGSFDAVVSCMALMDMPDLPRVLDRTRRLLGTHGRFVFSISHPLNTAAIGWERATGSDRGAMLVDRYFEERPGRLEWRMRRLKNPFTTVFWHRTLETWFHELRRAGFAVDGLWEPRATLEQKRRFPALVGSAKVPFYLVLSCRPLTLPNGKRSHDRSR